MFAACWCVVDDLRVVLIVDILIVYLLPRMFSLLLKGVIDRVDFTSYVESAVVDVSF